MMIVRGTLLVALAMLGAEAGASPLGNVNPAQWALPEVMHSSIRAQAKQQAKRKAAVGKTSRAATGRSPAIEKLAAAGKLPPTPEIRSQCATVHRLVRRGGATSGLRDAMRTCREFGL